MDNPKSVLGLVSRLREGFQGYQQLLKQEKYAEAESIRSGLASLWGEVQADVVDLGVPLYYSSMGITSPIFEGALKKYDSLFGGFVLGDIEFALTSLDIAIGKLKRLVKQQDSIQRKKYPKPSKRGNEIFIVHGHDLALREAVDRFVERLGLKPIVLSEQPNKGQTIIEKFEKNSRVTYAIVLLTPDDMGYPASSPELARPRARQNALLELGYFMAALGRENITILHVGDIEVPTDMSGILYVSAESDEWKLKIAQELESAGFQIDLNRVVD